MMTDYVNLCNIFNLLN